MPTKTKKSQGDLAAWVAEATSAVEALRSLASLVTETKGEKAKAIITKAEAALKLARSLLQKIAGNVKQVESKTKSLKKAQKQLEDALAGKATGAPEPDKEEPSVGRDAALWELSVAKDWLGTDVNSMSHTFAATMRAGSEQMVERIRKVAPDFLPEAEAVAEKLQAIVDRWIALQNEKIAKEKERELLEAAEKPAAELKKVPEVGTISTAPVSLKEQADWLEEHNSWKRTVDGRVQQRALEDWSEDSYKKIRRQWAAPEFKQSNETIQFAKFLDNDDLSSPGEVALFRGVFWDQERIDKFKVGGTVEFDKPSSWSSSPEVADRFATSQDSQSAADTGRKTVLLQIENEQQDAFPIMLDSASSAEYEYVLRDGRKLESKYEVVSIEEGVQSQTPAGAAIFRALEAFDGDRAGVSLVAEKGFTMSNALRVELVGLNLEPLSRVRSIDEGIQWVKSQAGSNRQYLNLFAKYLEFTRSNWLDVAKNTQPLVYDKRIVLRKVR